MSATLLSFFIFWGIWLLVPIIIDGLTFIVYLFGVMLSRRAARHNKKRQGEDFFPPLVTIIIPVYNGQDTLGICLQSIRKQSYPQELIHIVVVNDHSTDETFRVFSEQQARPFGGVMTWVENTQKGKVWALNAGIHLAQGTIIMTIDCDVIVQPNAIRNLVRAFHADASLGAATGVVEISPESKPVSSHWKSLLAECEAMEYLGAFRVGREYQTATNSLYTLSGAFSAFRREILLNTFLYDKSTIAEDTKITQDVRDAFAGQKVLVGCVDDAIAYVGPASSISQLYAQRVRWQRGGLEVAALLPSLRLRDVFRLRGLSMPRVLMIDHTMAFLRVVWLFLLPLLGFLGYSWSIVITALVGMYVFYALIELLCMIICRSLVGGDVKNRTRVHWLLWVVMPAYRFMIFWFRFAGFLNVLVEQAEWRVDDPWVQAKEGQEDLAKKARSWQAGS